jgi:Zn-dependent protease/CBS domain-containing protein
MSSTRAEVFRLFGIPVRVDFSWLLILFMITYSLAVGYFPAQLPGFTAPTYWGMGFVGAMGLFASILFHEFSHALVARHYQLKIDGITLFIFGGVAEMEDEAASPKVEFLMAAVGPLASLILAALFFGLNFSLARADANPGLQLLFYYLSFMNGILAIFNLVPAFPLDGGRIFRSALWAWQKDYNRATRISAYLGMAFGWLLVAYGGLQVVRGGLIGGFWYVLIGFFLKRASEASLSQLKMKKMLETVSVASVMETKFPSLNPRDSLLMVGEELTRETAFTNYPVVEEDRLIGYLSLLELNELKPEIWERGHVRDVLKRDLEGLLIGPQDNAWEALRRMRKRKIGNLFVSTADHLQGIVSLQDLLFFFQNQGRRANPS